MVFSRGTAVGQHEWLCCEVFNCTGTAEQLHIFLPAELTRFCQPDRAALSCDEDGRRNHYTAFGLRIQAANQRVKQPMVPDHTQAFPMVDMFDFLSPLTAFSD